MKQSLHENPQKHLTGAGNAGHGGDCGQSEHHAERAKVRAESLELRQVGAFDYAIADYACAIATRAEWRQSLVEWLEDGGVA